MAQVYRWRDLVDEVVRLFPEASGQDLLAAEGDIGALVMHLSATHELTLAEAAEMVDFRLPVFVADGFPDEHRLSA